MAAPSGDVAGIVRAPPSCTGVLALHNLSEKPASVRLRSKDAGHDRLVSLLDDEHSTARRGFHAIELDGYACRWFRVGGLDDILRRRGW